MESIQLPTDHPCADSWNSGRMSKLFKLMEAGDLGRQACREHKALHDNPFLYDNDRIEEKEQWEKSYIQAHNDRIQQNLKDTATEEFHSKANGLYPSGSRTVQEFNNGVNKITNCYWDSSFNCRVYFSITVFSSGRHSVKVTNVMVNT